MFSKAFIVLSALVLCQGAPTYIQNVEEVRQAINLFRDEANEALISGSQNLNRLIVEIDISSAAAEVKGLEQIDKYITLADKKIEEVVNEGCDVSACAQNARVNLAALLTHLTKEAKNCGSNTRKESIGVVNEVLDTSGSEAYYKREGFYRQMNACMKQENESCLNNILALVDEDIKVYPKELKKRFDQTTVSLNNIEKNMDKRFNNIDDEATKLTKNIVIEMSECIRSRRL